MIKFDIQAEDLKYIISALRPATTKTDYAHPADEYIKFQYGNKKLTAYSTDGYRIHSVTVPIDIAETKMSFAFLLKPFMVPKTDFDSIPCELSKKEITFDFGEQKITFKTGDTANFLNVQEAIPTGEIQYRIGFNPKYLIDAAKTLQRGSRAPLVMEFRDPLSPAVIYSNKNKSDFRIVLPIRLPKEVTE